MLFGLLWSVMRSLLCNCNILECHHYTVEGPLPHLYVQAAAILISSGVTMDSVLIQHWPAMVFMIAVITVMKLAAHVSWDLREIRLQVAGT